MLDGGRPVSQDQAGIVFQEKLLLTRKTWWEKIQKVKLHIKKSRFIAKIPRAN